MRILIFLLAMIVLFTPLADVPGLQKKDIPQDEMKKLQGVWQVLNTAAWDLEDHGASLGTPAGYGVVEGGRIPYLPAALTKKKENFENRTTADPEASCYLPGVPRITYMPFPFEILQFPDSVVIVYEYRSVTRSITDRSS